MLLTNTLDLSDEGGDGDALAVSETAPAAAPKTNMGFAAAEAVEAKRRRKVAMVEGGEVSAGLSSTRCRAEQLARASEPRGTHVTVVLAEERRRGSWA